MKIAIRYQGEQIKELDWLSIEAIEQYRYRDISPELIFFLSHSAKLLAIYVQHMLRKKTPQKVFAPSTLGWHTLGNDHFYLAGKEVITASGYTPPQKIVPRVPEDLAVLHLSSMPLQNESSIAKDFLRFFTSVPGISEILCLCTILGILYHPLQECDLAPDFWVWIVGQSGCGKTSLAKAFCSSYACCQPQAPNLVDLNSSLCAVEATFSKLTDSIVICDDKCISEDKALRTHHNQLLDNVMRNTTNQTSRSTAKGETSSACFIVGTAETAFSASSMVSRCLYLTLDSPVDFTALNCALEKPDAVSAFYRNFISYFAGTYSQQQKVTQHHFQKHLSQHACSFEGSRRIQKHCFHLQLALNILITYLETVFDNSHEEFMRFFKKVNAIILRLGDLQQSFLAEHAKTGLYCDILRKLLKSGALRIAFSQKSCYETDAGGYRKNGKLYLCPDLLLASVQRHTNDASITKNQIYAQLKQEVPGLVLCDSKGQSTQKSGTHRELVLLESKLTQSCSVTYRL